MPVEPLVAEDEDVESAVLDERIDQNLISIVVGTQSVEEKKYFLTDAHDLMWSRCLACSIRESTQLKYLRSSVRLAHWELRSEMGLFIGREMLRHAGDSNSA